MTCSQIHDCEIMMQPAGDHDREWSGSSVPVDLSQTLGADSVEQFIVSADDILIALEKDGTLGPTIRRFACDLATVVGNVSREWNEVDNDQRRQLARACLKDARNQLQLTDESATSSIDTFSDDEFDHRISFTKTLLLDIEDSLKSIGSDEAEEIAEVALVVIRIFLQTLKQWYRKLNDLNKAHVEIHMLDESPTNLAWDTNMNIGTVKKNDFDDNNVQSKVEKTRLLWPPMAPSVVAAAVQGHKMAMQNPILSIVLAMTLWPTALVACFIGAPIVATDWILQTTYDRFHHHPIMENFEKGASNLMNITKLYFLCSKLVVKQGIRVGKRQIERRGGLEKTVQDIGGWTIHRILHPVETVVMGSHAMMHGIGFLQEIIQKKQMKNTGVHGSNVPFYDCT